jgi:hypothetical protein
MMNRHANIEPLDRRMLCAERSLLLAFARWQPRPNAMKEGTSGEIDDPPSIVVDMISLCREHERPFAFIGKTSRPLQASIPR